MIKFFQTMLGDDKLRRACLVSFLLVLASLIVNFYAVHYAILRASGSVDDIVLSNIPVLDVDAVFVYGPLMMWVFVTWLLIRKPQQMPFTLQSVALFTVVRAAFVTLTHIGPFPTRDILTYGGVFGSLFSSGADLFFSGHTGAPFLLALMHWTNRPLRWFFIACSVIFGAAVLLGHFHYSIDVFASFFITYSIYHIAKWLFRSDYEAFVKVS